MLRVSSSTEASVLWLPSIHSRVLAVRTQSRPNSGTEHSDERICQITSFGEWRTRVPGGGFGIDLFVRPPRGALPLRTRAPVIPSKLVARLPEGPPMRIEPDDLARAGQRRDDNGLGMKFCWCPPGTFHMGGVAGRVGKSLDTLR